MPSDFEIAISLWIICHSQLVPGKLMIPYFHLALIVKILARVGID